LRMRAPNLVYYDELEIHHFLRRASRVPYSQ